MFLYQAPEQDRVVRKIRDGSKVSRQDETIKHLSTGWIPAIPQVVDGILTAAHSEATVDRQALIAKVKCDPGLFVYCARHLSHAAGLNSEGHDIFKVLETIEAEKLAVLLPGTSAHVSPHPFSQIAEPPKLLRTQHTLLTSVAAEALAEATRLSGSQAYCAAMFFELGLNLIAWNYPRIYSQVMTRHRKYGADIERELTILLGIGPSRIGMRLATEWGIDRQVREVLSRDGQLADTVTNSLREVVRVSTLLADAQDSFNFPEAPQAFNNDRSPIRALLDEQMIERLRNKVVSMIAPYSEPDGPLSKLPFLSSVQVLDPSPSPIDVQYDSNQFAPRLPRHLQEALRQLYALNPVGSVTPEALKRFSDQTVLDFGFARGCLYLVDSRIAALSPVIRFGATALPAYQRFLKNLANGISGSLYSRSPFCKVAPGVSGKLTLQLSSSLDHSRYEGVLYIESDDLESEFSAVLRFQALRRALNQLLGER